MDKKNKVTINLQSGIIEIESTNESVDSLIKKADSIARKLSSNNKPNEYGIR